MDDIITLDLATWAFLGGTVVPILVGILTKLHLSSGLKGLVNVVLSAVVGLIASEATTDGVLTQDALVGFFMALAVSIATYYGVYRPNGVTGAIQFATRNFGIGPKGPSEGLPRAA